MDGSKKDILFFDDGSNISRKEGHVVDIKEGLVFFSEYGKIQLIPVSRIIRIEKGVD